ncbi:4Fe-4S binding protein [Candidatus Clostridium radicumherbarum]|uniref:4Fe-4S binding protein n=1 Tax=Candidatus Clostridium radicumherbarum TaxID=3381662 RepID=A0ABW8TV11_9CLOT
MDIKELFKILVKAYYEDNFETVVDNLLIEQKESKDTLNKIISALCGVDSLDIGDEYSRELKTAIFNYTSSNKVVIRVKDCTLDCMNAEGKTKCQSNCTFDAISIDAKLGKLYIDKTKCTDCGFCVDACPNNCYMDKVEFIPLIKHLDNKERLI